MLTTVRLVNTSFTSSSHHLAFVVMVRTLNHYSHSSFQMYRIVLAWGFSGGAVVKNPPTKGGDTEVSGSIPGSGRSPGEGNGNPLQYSCLGNPMDRGAWRTIVLGAVESGTWLSDSHFQFICTCTFWEFAHWQTWRKVHRMDTESAFKALESWEDVRI